MTPLQAYQQQLDEHVLSPNSAQHRAMEILDDIHFQLIHRQKQRDSTAGKIRRKIKPRKPILGLYMWGGVGVGKTHLMDLFYECVPVRKMRVHFHQFMQRIHQELYKRQGEKNPLTQIGNELADDYLLICFDEFFVSNITDAMLLTELFTAMFNRGLCLVASSNVEPRHLYADGLQREQFLPTIRLLERNTIIMHLTATRDYRLRHIQQAGVYYTPLSATSEMNMEHSFRLFSKNRTISSEPITLFGREITIIKQAARTIWFEFSEICGIPRSQKDFLELAKQYRTVMISNVPIIKKGQDGLITSFINLIDVLYDAHIRVVISAEAAVEQLYTEGNCVFEFERTKSRLIEMQSVDYFDPSSREGVMTHL